MLNDTTNWQDWENNPPANTWTAIGTSVSNRFIGTFNGNGYVISGVYINSSSSGFFGITTGSIKNLGLIASYIKAGSYVGVLVGSGWMTGSSIDGANEIINCYTNVNVSAANISNVSAGGLFGSGNAKIENCYSIGKVMIPPNFVSGSIGGLAGVNSNIINSYYNSETVGQALIMTLEHPRQRQK